MASKVSGAIWVDSRWFSSFRNPIVGSTLITLSKNLVLIPTSLSKVRSPQKRNFNRSSCSVTFSIKLFWKISLW